MSNGSGITFAIVLLMCTQGVASAMQTKPDAVISCNISMPRAAQEADFVAIYKFEIKNDKPINIVKIKNEFLPDRDFTNCMSQWRLRSFKDAGIAQFFYKHAVGWTEIRISDSKIDKSFPLQ